MKEEFRPHESSEPKNKYEDAADIHPAAASVENGRTEHDVKAWIEHLDSRITVEREKLRAIRSQLSLPELDDDKLSSTVIRELQYERDQLAGTTAPQTRERSSTLPVEQGLARDEGMDSPDVRRALSDVAQNVGSLANIFRKRGESGLYPLLDREDVSRLSTGARSLDGMQGRKDYAEITAALSSMRRGLEKFGTYRSFRVNEDRDSLGAIYAYAQQAAESTRALQRALSEGGQKGADEAARAASQLSNAIEDIQLSTRRRAQRMDEYSGRR